MRQYLTAAKVTNPRARFIGISLDTSRLGEAERVELRNRLEGQHHLPVIDPMRDSASRLAAAIERDFPRTAT